MLCLTIPIGACETQRRRKNGLYDIGAHGYGGVPPNPTDTPMPTATPTEGSTPTPTNTPTPTATPSGGTNLALSQPVEVTSYENVGTTGDKAVDGDLGTYWRSKKKSGLPSEWIKVDLIGISVYVPMGEMNTT